MKNLVPESIIIFFFFFYDFDMFNFVLKIFYNVCQAVTSGLQIIAKSEEISERMIKLINLGSDNSDRMMKHVFNGYYRIRKSA